MMRARLARERLASLALGGRTFLLDHEVGDGALWLVELGDRAHIANRLSGEGPIAISTQGRWLLAGRNAPIEAILDATGDRLPAGPLVRGPGVTE